ncbi:Uncharacterized protein CLAVI_000824 [Candidatus Clavichlamydia salmonicola]|uniref:FAD-dependent monooxygenase n=1 Tax=Candidatus Clavichlamydia salmonicola TaxID=469812 RepID=UPI0018912558|nr:FAD-dependent monooxygenase [Candidatus Clavichlamydia salmonicola]MBF5051186.1 Uncharacterized protein [Candidatus Clavichlamydia salmonicola]
MEKVLIIGANPTGLILAHELLRCNVPFRIIDPHSNLTSLSFPIVLDPFSIDLLDRAGLLNKLIQEMIPLTGLSFNANKQSIYINMSEYTSLQSFFTLTFNTFTTFLLRSLEEKGIQVEWNKRVVTLIDKKIMLEDTKEVLNNDIGPRTIMDPLYVVICEGDTYPDLMDTLHISKRNSKKSLFYCYPDISAPSLVQENTLHVFGSGKYIYSFLPQLNGLYGLMGYKNKIFFKEDSAELENYLSDVTPIIFEPIIYKMPFKKYNLFFAGRFLRNFYNFGSYSIGINIKEAFNIAWKLILSVSDNASEVLMRSYDKEMSKIAKNDLAKQARYYSILNNLGAIWPGLLHFLLKITSYSQCIKKLLYNKFILPKLNYEHSPIIKEHVSDKEWPGPRPGSYAPAIISNNNNLPFSFLNAGKHLLIFFQDRPQLIHALQAEYAPWLNIIVITDEQFLALYHGSPQSIYLIRPDGYISYRSNHFKLKELISYFLRIFPIHNR